MKRNKNSLPQRIIFDEVVFVSIWNLEKQTSKETHYSMKVVIPFEVTHNRQFYPSLKKTIFIKKIKSRRIVVKSKIEKYK